MLRKRYYIVFIARDEDGQLRRIPLPLKYAYGFVLAAIVGAFTIVGLAGSYTRMLLKTERFNQVRAERETLRQNYQRMEQIAHNRSVQVASLGALANEVTALYGLRENRLDQAKPTAASDVSTPAAPSIAQSDDISSQQIANSIDNFYALRNEALSGQVSRALESGLSSSFTGDWTELADAPSHVAGRRPHRIELRRAPRSDQRRRRLPLGRRHRSPLWNSGAGRGRRLCNRRRDGRRDTGEPWCSTTATIC